MWSGGDVGLEMRLEKQRRQMLLPSVVRSFSATLSKSKKTDDLREGFFLGDEENTRYRERQKDAWRPRRTPCSGEEATNVR
ncbi:hypothetical protein MRB53_002556 [Persea americana]|uniref:Uncharacterized protein n=1 Tax=Persea americana TaxID=3435 RepID=A0ACC2MVI7_PERAE|nr:hypothetical protein MRB53_002556 [Persea americana]